MITENSTIFDGMPTVLVILIVKSLVAFSQITSHFVWPFEVWLTLYFFKDLMNRFFEYQADHLSFRAPSVTSKISPRSIMVIPLCPRISRVRRRNFGLPLPFMLILHNLFMLINSIYELTHILRKLCRKRLSQVMVSGKAYLKCFYC